MKKDYSSYYLETTNKLDVITEISDIFDELNNNVSIFELDEAKDLWCLRIYFQDKNQKEIIETLLANNGIKIEDIKFFDTPDLDWLEEVAKSFPAISVGKFHIISNYVKDQTPDRMIEIKIEASRAFGTGEHYTTKSCLKLIDYVHDNNLLAKKSILDLGTGSGILAIAAAKIFGDECQIIAADNDAIAVNIAQENCFLNNVADIQTIESYGFSNELIQQRKYNLITANILANPLIEMAKDFALYSENNGLIILSGFLTNQEKDIDEAFSNYNFTKISRCEDNNWLACLYQHNYLVEIS